MDNLESGVEETRIAWRIKAQAQGLVCMICGRIPRLERRELFYDTGICQACEEVSASASRPA